METFNDLTLSAPLARAIADMGFEKPSPIQAETLPILLGQRTDFLGLAATGSGKTAAYGIPLLEKIDPTGRHVQALILCPTRELALQVSGQINLLGKYMGIKSVPVYGGASYGDQIRGLKMGAQIVVGTPGRVIDHLERGTMKFDGVTTVVLDEADEMISMGFKEALERILDKVDREKCNTWLFSATMSPSVRKVAHDYLTDPAKVEINRTEVVPTTVEQIFFMCKESDKAEIICKLMDSAEDFYGLIFCQTKSLVVDLCQYLSDHGYKVDSLHGDKSQDARERTMRSFRDRKIKVLVCTDVASRGLDVKDITHVINYSLPRELDNYVHRIGRTARSGKKGIAFSLVTPSHRALIGKTEQRTKSRMTQGTIPNRRDIGSKKIAKLLPTFQEVVGFDKAAKLLDESWKTALAAMTPEEIAARFISILVPDVFQFDAEREERPRREYQARDERPRDDRPSRSFNDRPQRSFSDRAPREEAPSNGQPSRSFNTRAPGADAPASAREERPARSFSDRGPRREDSGPRKPFPKAFGKKFGHQQRDERKPVEKQESFDGSQLVENIERTLKEERTEKPKRSIVRDDARPERLASPVAPAREPRVADADRPHVPFYDRKRRDGPGKVFGGPKARVRSGGYGLPKRKVGYPAPKRTE